MNHAHRSKLLKRLSASLAIGALVAVGLTGCFHSDDDDNSIIRRLVDPGIPITPTPTRYYALAVAHDNSWLFQNGSTATEAESKALSTCRSARTGCELWFDGAFQNCAALAESGDRRALYGAKRATRQQAINAALSNCRNDGHSGCHIARATIGGVEAVYGSC